MSPNVGTMFVNTMANALSCYAQEVSLQLVPQLGGKFNGAVLGDFMSSEESWGRHLHLGPLQYG